jgi:hypothetical protein
MVQQDLKEYLELPVLQALKVIRAQRGRRVMMAFHESGFMMVPII